MDMMLLIVGLSTIMWYIIDRFKTIWEQASAGKYVTIAVSALFGFALAFGYDLDIVCAAGLVETCTTTGTILTGLTLMAGSSAVSEVIARIKGE